MKKTILLIIASALFFYVKAQEKPNFFSFKKEKVGIQINPYFNPAHVATQGWVAAGRFGVANGFGLSFGAEITYIYGADYQYAESQGLLGGVFGRYAFLTPKKISPFIEAQGFLSIYGEIHYYHETWLSQIPRDNWFANTQLQYYVAPGFSFFLYKEKFSMDIMLKLTTQTHPISTFKALPSFRVNYHF